MRNHIIRSILLVLLASQCSDRERLNPIDPRNPVTGGKPAGLTLSSDKRAVFARWDHIDNKSVTGYHLWRKREDQEEFVLVAALSGDSTNWSDSITHYDSSYAYEISATTTTWETPKSDPETIIPGPFNYWIADFFAGLLRRISYDGAHLLFEDYADSPVSIQMAQSQRSLWLASSYPARIRRLTVDGILEFSRALPASPVDLAVDGISGDVFIAMLGSPDVVRLDSTGGERDVLPCKVTFTLGTELAVDPLKKQLWAALADSDFVVKIDFTAPENATIFRGLRSPVAISAMVGVGLTWIATDSGVVSIDDGERIQYYLPGLSIIDLDVNEENREVWLIAYDRRENVWLIDVVEFRENGWTPRVFLRDAFPFSSRIKANPGEEHGGILIHQSLTGRIIRVDSQGKEMGSYRGFSSALDMAIER